MGAFIALKEAPRNAWMEACVGIGGPMLGSLGALVCNALGEFFAAPIFIALAWFGYFLNLFNLTPVGMLDGGRIVTALSRWLWLPGFALLLWFGWKYPNFIIWLIVLLSLPRIYSLFRKRTEEEERYFEVTPAQRWIMSVLYFGLIALLLFGMHVAQQRSGRLRCSRTRSRAGRYRAINGPSVSDAKQRFSQKRLTNPGMAKPRIPSPHRVRFLAESRGTAYPNAKVQIQERCLLKCNDDECSSQARSSSRIASSYSSNTTCTCAIASPGV